jgi:hypothetical protein
MPRRRRDDMPDPERVFDDWFAKLPRAEKARYKAAGIIPHREMPGQPNVFPVMENHRAYGVTDDSPPEPEVEEFISATELRVRLRAVFDALDLFASADMAAYLAFIRTVLGGDGATSLASLASRFGISKQAMAWRSRRILRALAGVHRSSALVDEVLAASGGGDAADPIPEPPCPVANAKTEGPYLIIRDTVSVSKTQQPRAIPAAGRGAKASLCSKVSNREAQGSAVFSKKRGFRGGRYPTPKAQPKKIVKRAQK